jgi:GNAT superfamily N-acetyltransferase
MEYRSPQTADYECIRTFLVEHGWQHRVSDPERFRRLMENTDRSVVAVEAGRIVGFARALCDDVSNGYISMVAVAEDRRRQGIGRELVSRIIGTDPEITWILRAGRQSAGFWRKLGFQPSELAMEKVRQLQAPTGREP